MRFPEIDHKIPNTIESFNMDDWVCNIKHINHSFGVEGDLDVRYTTSGRNQARNFENQAKSGKLWAWINREKNVNNREIFVNKHSWAWSTVFGRERRIPKNSLKIIINLEKNDWFLHCWIFNILFTMKDRDSHFRVLCWGHHGVPLRKSRQT